MDRVVVARWQILPRTHGRPAKLVRERGREREKERERKKGEREGENSIALRESVPRE